jgi:hypothetical protein
MSTLLPRTPSGRGWAIVVTGVLVLLIGYLLAVFGPADFFLLFFVSGTALISIGSDKVRRGRQLPSRPDLS